MLNPSQQSRIYHRYGPYPSAQCVESNFPRASNALLVPIQRCHLLRFNISLFIPNWLPLPPLIPLFNAHPPLSRLPLIPSCFPPQFPNFKSISVPSAQVDQTIALEKHNADDRDENDAMMPFRRKGFRKMWQSYSKQFTRGSLY